MGSQHGEGTEHVLRRVPALLGLAVSSACSSSAPPEACMDPGAPARTIVVRVGSVVLGVPSVATSWGLSPVHSALDWARRMISACCWRQRPPCRACGAAKA